MNVKILFTLAHFKDLKISLPLTVCLVRSGDDVEQSTSPIRAFGRCGGDRHVSEQCLFDMIRSRPDWHESDVIEISGRLNVAVAAVSGLLAWVSGAEDEARLAAIRVSGLFLNPLERRWTHAEVDDEELIDMYGRLSGWGGYTRLEESSGWRRRFSWEWIDFPPNGDRTVAQSGSESTEESAQEMVDTHLVGLAFNRHNYLIEVGAESGRRSHSE